MTSTEPALLVRRTLWRNERPVVLDEMKTGYIQLTIDQQPFLQGFWPVMQLYLQIDRGISAANLDTRAQLVTKADVDKVGKRYEN
mgnify:CR=1 FL=1